MTLTATRPARRSSGVHGTAPRPLAPHTAAPRTPDSRAAVGTPAGPARPAVPAPAAPRRNPGFVLYVGVDAAPGEQPQAQLVELAEALGELARDWLPSAETYTALALAEPTTATTSPVQDIAAFRERLATLSPVPRVVIDPAGRTVTVEGRSARLTFREIELLSYLARTAHRVVTRAELLETVWADHEVAAGSRTIDVHVRRLREKLGLEHVITTVRGLGYRFDPQTPVVLGGTGDAA
ncbi:winged helix-turn-helix domain-containing protein [Cellulosimicrobium protaetiae]|uniref:Winged helix-turn-helix transcriptional regulator n=1 Tax=Cellulosimicrobium protaetiae TaxID=2587808 RepID=A0A6M5UG89_9MICO|nr:winged helix-turn-helix domain-containing protein [Cellulosimicrobium protaetiae]QJW35639.1 winged helix-turn-helix transcriptional regulator [Cellulosimicrobium protaetiae]